MNIAIASKNPLKIEGIEQAFSEFFPEEEINLFPYEVNSNVRRQPIESEIYNGAKFRLKNLKNILEEDVDFMVSCEAGLITLNGLWFNQHVILIQKYDGTQSVGISGGFMIPQDKITDVINADLKVAFGSKAGISRLSNGLTSRCDLIKQGTVLALAGFNEW